MVMRGVLAEPGVLAPWAEYNDDALILPPSGDEVMALEIEAIYDNGVLKLPRELPLENGLRVRITIHPPGRGVQRGAGRIGWTGDPETLRQVALDPEFGIEGPL
jgi:predicted DNA-binding antitoxin AbrB/MazE fold protein